MIASSLSAQNRHLLYCWILSFLAEILLVLMALFCATMRRDSKSLLRFPFLSHIQVACLSIEMSIALFSFYFCFLSIFSLVLRRINHFRLFNAKSIFIHINNYNYEWRNWYIRLENTMTRKSCANLHAKYGALNNYFDLIRSYQQCTPWSPPLVIEPTTTVCRSQNSTTWHTEVVGSISSGGDHGLHCWWDLIRSKQLFRALYVACRCVPDFLVMVISHLI